MATRYRYVFEFSAAGLVCGLCPLWHKVEYGDSYCLATDTKAWEQAGFEEWGGRLDGCPLVEDDDEA